MPKLTAQEKEELLQFIEADQALPEKYRSRLFESTETDAALKQAESALKLSEFSVQKASLPTFWIARNSRIVRVNRAACELLGYTEAELLTKSITELDPNYTEDVWPSHWKELRERKQMCFETEQRHKNGQIVPIEVDLNWFEFEGEEYNFAFIRDITAQKRAKASLKLSEFSVQNSSVPTFWVTKDSKIVRVNGATLEMLGYTEEELLSKCITDLSPHFGGEVWPSHWQAIRDQGQVRFESVQIHKDGHTIPVEADLKWLEYEGVEYVFAFVRNISARKLVEESLSTTAELLNRTGELAKIGGWQVDLLDMTQTWTAETFKIAEIDSGIAPSVSLGIELFAPEARPVIQKAVEDCIENTTPYDLKLPVITAKGNHIWVRAQGSAVQEEGKVVKLIGTFQDITEQVKSADALRMSDAAIKAVSQGVIITDAQKNIISANDAFSSITGYSSEELLGKNCRFLQGPLTDPDQLQAIRDATHNGVEFSGELQNYRKDQTVFWNELSISPVRDEKGQPTHFIGVIRDISVRKQAEQDILAAKDLAESAARSKSDFLATMSHEIRTPMNGVLGFTDLLMDTDLTPEQHSFTAIIKNSGNALLTIIDDILDFSKIDADKLALEPHAFDLQQTIQGVTDLLTSKARDKAIHLQVEYPIETPHLLMADSNRVRQVALNLIGNALKFTEHGKVITRVSEIHIGNNRFIKVEVIDSGVGIPPEKQAQLFQKFTQADSSTTRRFGGTGLGLAISKRLVELMGGQVGLESQVGIGSTFWFTLPLVEATMRPETPVATSPDLCQPLNLSVLVVEDARTNQILILRLLQKFGCQTDLATDGHQAVQMFQHGRYDIVLMDCHMPGKDGFEASQEIRSFENTSGRSRTSIIAVTASVMQEEIDHCLAVGMDAVIGKPLRQDELYNMLQRHCLQRAS